MRIRLTAADLRDPAESGEILYEVEGPIEREGDEGFCYCSPARLNPWDDDLDAFVDTVESLADYAEISREEAAELIRRKHSEGPIKLSSPHMHLKVRGLNPDASPRYYEMPLRWK
ncbi:MAG: hypothetical protein DMF84_11565 [Acidobacteria bacterium]|nr:MAG: hypothetical protein DMF84_11565 [Acidobacteriota bacterium]